jgi:hypothetical protein
MDRPYLRQHRERNALGDRVRRIIRHRHLVGIGAKMVERIDDNGGLGGQPDHAEQMLFEIRPHRENRIEQQQQPAATREVLYQHIGLARRERSARADIGHDRAVGRDGVGFRGDDAAHLVADLGERELQAVELLRRGDQHIAGARHVMALERLHVAVVKVRLGLTEGLAVAGDETDCLDPFLEHAQRRIG